MEFCHGVCPFPQGQGHSKTQHSSQSSGMNGQKTSANRFRAPVRVTVGWQYGSREWQPLPHAEMVVGHPNPQLNLAKCTWPEGNIIHPHT